MVEQTILAAARSGDRDAFTRLSEPHRRELLVHCYRIVGSFQVAEDMVQETFLRAWRRLETFEGRASFRAWLYKIATNACLEILRKTPRRALIPDHIPASESPYPVLEPVEEPIWLEPLPDSFLPSDDQDPEARYTMRESVRLAFLTVLQRLPPRQRAILILRDVLNWETRETAYLLDMTESAVTSALHRARQTLGEQYRAARPEDSALTETLLARYIQAWENADMESLIALLKADALFTMPPMPSWYRGQQAIRAMLKVFAFPDERRGQWRFRPVHANGQPAVALYRYDHAAYRIMGVQIPTVEDGLIARIDSFLHPAWVRRFDIPLELNADGR